MRVKCGKKINAQKIFIRGQRKKYKHIAFSSQISFRSLSFDHQKQTRPMSFAKL